MKPFDYEKKIWGGQRIKPSLFYVQGLKLRYALKDLSDVKGRVLDVGCGAGNISKVIKQQRPDLEVFGVDISRRATEAAEEDPQGVRFEIGSVKNLPFEDRSFEAVLVFDLLEHLEEPRQALAEIRRVLKPGGLFILFAPLEGRILTLYWLLEKFGWRGKEKHCGHVQKFTYEILKNLLKKENFSISKKRFSFHCLGQILDICFDIFLAERLAVGLEEHLERKGNQILRFGKNVLVFLANLESVLLRWLPGGGVQVTCLKQD